MSLRFKPLLILVWWLASIGMVWAAEADISPEKRLEICIKKAHESPDITLAEAQNWQKNGGGDRARLCAAFAQFQRGEFIISAQEFGVLAQKRDVKDRKHAASLHTQSGLAYMRANDHKNAEVEFEAALRLEPHDPEIWLDRATERVTVERYWDAIDDLKQALAIEPDMSEALRLRGQAWTKLGNDSNAKADFERAAIVEEQDGLLPPKKN